MAQQIKKKYLSSEVISYFDDQINTVESSVTQEISDRISGDASTLSGANSYTDGEISTESAARVSGDAASVSSANAYTDGEVSAEAALRVSGDAASVSSSNSYTDSQIALAQGDISAAEAAIAQEIIDRAAADASLQTQINNVLSNVDGTALDSLTEIVSAFQAADSSLNGAITALSTGLTADIDAEEAARIAGDNALDGRLDVLEAVVWFKEKFSIVNGQTSVTLSFAPKASSMSAFVDRLGIHEGASDDFTISGTAMTFLNDLVSPGNSQLGNGDTVYVKYQK